MIRGVSFLVTVDGTPEVVTLSFCFFAWMRGGGRDPMSKVVVIFEGESSSVHTNSQKGVYINYQLDALIVIYS